MINFIKRVFQMKDEPQDLLTEGWFRMRRSILEQEIQDAIADCATYTYNRDKCHKNDPKRKVWQECLQGAMSRRLDAHNELIRLQQQVGAL